MDVVARQLGFRDEATGLRRIVESATEHSVHRRALAAVAVSRTLGRERAETRRWRAAVAQGRGDVGRHGATAGNGRAVLDDEIDARTTWSAAHELKDDVLAARRALAAVAGSSALRRESRDAAMAGGGGAGAW